MSLNLKLIAACDSKMGIGLKNDLPWRLKNEMAYFTRMTTVGPKAPEVTSEIKKQNVVVMGRKSWDAIPLKFRPLKNRINVVLSRSAPKEDINRDDVIWTTSWDEVIEKLMSLQKAGNISNFWVIGGSFLYKFYLTFQLAMESPHCHRIYLTRITGDYGCDVFFPSFDSNQFQAVTDPDVPAEEQKEGEISYKYCVYERKQMEHELRNQQ